MANYEKAVEISFLRLVCSAVVFKEYSGCTSWLQRADSCSFVLALYIKVQEQTNKNNPLITAFVAYRTIATEVVDSMNFVAVVVHFVISTIYVENYEMQQIHILGSSERNQQIL